MEALKSDFKHLQLGVRQDMDGMKKYVQETKSFIEELKMLVIGMNAPFGK